MRFIKGKTETFERILHRNYLKSFFFLARIRLKAEAFFYFFGKHITENWTTNKFQCVESFVQFSGGGMKKLKAKWNNFWTKGRRTKNKNADTQRKSEKEKERERDRKNKRNEAITHFISRGMVCFVFYLEKWQAAVD